MKKIVLAVVLSAIVFPVFSSESENTEQQYADTCKMYAKDDGISAEEMDEYLENCIKDLQ